MKHEKFTITITFRVCGGMRAKVLEELKKLRLLVLGNELQDGKGHFDHASDVKFYVAHEEVSHE